MINKKCLACDHFRDNCNGKAGDCGRHTQIDFARAALGLAALKVWQLPESPLKELAVGETRQQKFARIGRKRQQQALEAIRKLEHLTSRYHRKRSNVTTYTYEWTAEEARDLLAPIEAALAKLHDELLTAPPQREHGLTTEKK